MFGFGKKQKINISQTSHGSHGDHWSAIFGFEDPAHMESSVESLFDDLQFEKKISRNIVKYRTKFGLLSVIGIQSGNNLDSLFPALYPAKTIPVNIRMVSY